MDKVRYTTQKHREWVIKVLTELQSNCKHIKEQVRDLSPKVEKTEQELNFIKGIGSVITLIFGALFTLFFKK